MLLRMFWPKPHSLWHRRSPDTFTEVTAAKVVGTVRTLMTTRMTTMHMCAGPEHSAACWGPRLKLWLNINGEAAQVSLETIIRHFFHQHHADLRPACESS